ncbi:PqqD family protein [Geminocystis sp. NIES-3709]|uniref:PqqD family protein n=1 Tax=Geminocystis sp. NIES-3709 TaxID=1617448 RepID=UPI0005FC9F30|nr:PqqD family protein [Geminocystis sp. NIES-3709]BAQ65151.1 hypothetical protein GM3709_1916 [Geminocystis sp. NIES-3709]
MDNSFQINTKKIAEETIDGEVMIINLDEGYYYSLLDTGADIWNGIKNGLSYQEIISDLSKRYFCSQKEIEISVENLIAQLVEEDIILSLPKVRSQSKTNYSLSAEGNENIEKLEFKIPQLQKYTDMQDLLTLDPIHDVDETGWPNSKQV